MGVVATCAPPLPVVKPLGIKLPDKACDCHFHIFDKPSVQVEGRSYTAPLAPLNDYRTLQKKLGLTRSVIVQPSVYGRDNRTTLGVKGGDPDMRAVVVIDAATPKEHLAELADAGAVGCRVNLLFASNVVHENLQELAHRIADFGWHIQILADLSNLENISDIVKALPVPVVFDHLGHIPADKGVKSSAFQRCLKLLSEGDIWVKLSGAYRVTAQDSPGYLDVRPMVEALVRSNPERLVWGSDWPHPQIPVAMPDDTDLLRLFLEWVPEAEARQKILVDNPGLLYDFD
jgi:predicted TIM-barrel fold metal-dependent hydrolase